MIRVISFLCAVLSVSMATATPFVEFCAGDQYLSKAFGNGNPAGHSLIYIEGLCKDEESSYPRVKVCEGDEDHTGVGISLDSGFKNVKWIAVPTRELTLMGVDQHFFDDSSIKKIIDKAKSFDVFRGVEMREEVFPESIKNFSSDKIDQYVLYSIGTDLAFAAARNVYCQKALLSHPSDLNLMAQYLNQLNDDLIQNKKEYRYNINDNCTHVGTNVINQVGLSNFRQSKEDRSLLGTLLNLTLPKTELLKITRLVTESNFDPDFVWGDKDIRNYFLTKGTLPYRAGNLFSKISMIPENKYFTKEKSKFLSLPVRGQTLNRAMDISLMDVEENLIKYLKSVEAALRDESFKKMETMDRKSEKYQFFLRYKQYLEGEKVRYTDPSTMVSL